MAAQRFREADYRKPRMKNPRTRVLVEILAPFFKSAHSPFGGGALFFFYWSCYSQPLYSRD